jgi:homopolymeric O-antigen transport system permease protein
MRARLRNGAEPAMIARFMETTTRLEPTRASIGEEARLTQERRGLFARFIADLRAVAVDELWKHRELVWQFTLRDVRIRYKQAVMGFAWAILTPALVVAAGVLVRLAMAYLGGGSVEGHQVAGLAIKAVAWSFFVGSVGFGVSSLTGNLPLITKINFPRESLPLASALAQSFDSSIGLAVVLVAMPFLGITPSLSMLWIVPLLTLLFTFTLGVSLFLGCGNLFFRDVKYIVQVMLTFGIFFTPVFFEPYMFGATGAQLMMINPLAPIIEGLRLAVTEGHNLLVPLTMAGKNGGTITVWNPLYLLWSAFWALGGLSFSAVMFHRLETLFAEYA